MKRKDAWILLCDCLSFRNKAGEGNDALRRKLQSGSISWESLVEIANRHLLCPALYSALDRKQLLFCIPDELRLYLATLHELNGERNRHLIDLALETIRRLNEIGVEPVLLKGTANLLCGLYEDPSLRFISDIDLLVPEEELLRCVDCLRSAGYEALYYQEPAKSLRQRHYPPLLKKNDYIYIELHCQVVPRKLRTLIAADSVIASSYPIIKNGAHARLPAAGHRILHNVVHTQLIHCYYPAGFISLRQLYDFVLLAGTLEDKIDWPSIAGQFKRNGKAGALSGYILAGERFLGYPKPPGIEIDWRGSLYYRLLLIQLENSLAMRMGFISWICFSTLESLCENPRVPKVWSLKWYRNQFARISEAISQRW